MGYSCILEQALCKHGIAPWFFAGQENNQVYIVYLSPSSN